MRPVVASPARALRPRSTDLLLHRPDGQIAGVQLERLRAEAVIDGHRVLLETRSPVDDGPLHTEGLERGRVALDDDVRGRMVGGDGIVIKHREAFRMKWTIVDGGPGFEKDSVTVDDGFRAKPLKLYAGDLTIGTVK